MDEKTWQSWRALPQTVEFFAAIKLRYEQEKEQLACGAYDPESPEQTALMYANTRGGLDLLRDFAEMRQFEQFEELTHEENDIGVE